MRYCLALNLKNDPSLIAEYEEHHRKVWPEIKISITDSGRGIPHEQQADMFTLKARSTFGTANEKGVGLGLILCKEFTEQQGGHIDFESTPGKGSTFYIFMPIG